MKVIEETTESKILEFRKKYSPDELKSIINFIPDPINKFIIEKMLIGEK